MKRYLLLSAVGLFLANTALAQQAMLTQVAGQVSVAIAIRLGGKHRGQKLSTRPFLALQQADPGREQFELVPVASGGNGLSRKPLQLGRKGHVVHVWIIGRRRAFAKDGVHA